MRPSLAIVMVGAVLGVAASGVTAQEFFRLASAQVVESTDRPPMLKLTANGPIAFQVETAAESGADGSPNQLVIRLYGVTVEQGAALDAVAPFSVATTAIDHSTRVLVRTAALPAGERLQVRAGSRTSEIEVFSAPE